MSINTKLLEEDLTKFCRSESLSEDGLREIIERHGVAPNNNNDITNNKFFHSACDNEKVTEGILRCLLEYFPNAVRYVGKRGRLPLHNILGSNKNVTLGMVQLLIDAFPDSLHHENNKGSMPLHVLCNSNNNLDDEVGLKILKLLLERCPESVRHARRVGMLPIHFAAAYQSPEFCRVLIEAYPGSERITNDNVILPFHAACGLNTVATAKYLYQLYPESINVANNHGYYPIHCAIEIEKRRNPATAVKIIQFLLDCDPNVVMKKQQGKLPLYWVCKEATNENTPKLDAYLKILQILYDAYPDAILDNDVASNVGEFCTEVQTFINSQLTYARQARDRALMNVRDENGQLPLHKALRDNANLGSIKLLVKGNPSAISCADNKGMIPLHVACQHHASASVVEYLINLDPTSLRAKDFNDNTALHYACHGANHAIVALLLDKYGSMYVSKRNAHGQLPIDLLLQNKNEVRDEESVKFIESIYRLIRANPETLMHYDLRQAGSEDCISQTQSKKKRKVD